MKETHCNNPSRNNPLLQLSMRMFLIMIIACAPISALTPTERKRLLPCRLSRRGVLKYLTLPTTAIATVQLRTLKAAEASNLPKSNGADLSKTGTVETLVPIIDMMQHLVAARESLHSASIAKSSDGHVSKSLLQQISVSLEPIPLNDEIAFKKMFDAYSDPVSYKQKFLDSNAFLVYYSKGFDGPGRPSIESGAVPIQVIQYGERNDCWAALDEFAAEFIYARDKGSEDVEIRDLLNPLSRCTRAFENYSALAPVGYVEEAKRLLK